MSLSSIPGFLVNSDNPLQSNVSYLFTPERWTLAHFIEILKPEFNQHQLPIEKWYHCNKV